MFRVSCALHRVSFLVAACPAHTAAPISQSNEPSEFEPPQETDVMAKGQQRSNRETKKPKKDKVKATAAAPSRKDAAWQPEIGQGKKK
jgi:hypothetical protein